MLLNKQLLETYKILTDRSIAETKNQLKEFQESNDRIYKIIEDGVHKGGKLVGHETFLKCYDAFLSCMSTINEALRKLNIQLYLNNVEKHDPEKIFSELCVLKNCKLNSLQNEHQKEIENLDKFRSIDDKTKQSIESNDGQTLSISNDRYNFSISNIKNGVQCNGLSKLEELQQSHLNGLKPLIPLDHDMDEYFPEEEMEEKETPKKKTSNGFVLSEESTIIQRNGFKCSFKPPESQEPAKISKDEDSSIIQCNGVKPLCKPPGSQEPAKIIKDEVAKEPTFYKPLCEEFNFQMKKFKKQPNAPFLECCVTYVHDYDEFEFFIMELSDPNALKITTLKPLGKLNNPIDLNEIFAIKRDDAWLRVVASKTQDPNALNQRVLLVDFGEVIEIPKNQKKFKIAKEDQDIQPQAIPAKWVLMCGTNKETLKKILKSIKHKPANFFVLSSAKPVLEVVFFDIINGKNKPADKFRFDNEVEHNRFSYKDFMLHGDYNKEINDKKDKEMPEQKTTNKTSNPFLNVSLDDLTTNSDTCSITSIFINNNKPNKNHNTNKNKNTKKNQTKNNNKNTNKDKNSNNNNAKNNNHERNKSKATTKPFNNKGTSSDSEPPEENKVESLISDDQDNENTSSIRNATMELNADDLAELWDEPLDLDNPLESILGYAPKDEQRICKNYDPETGGCFKGGACRKEHKFIDPNGWTKDMNCSNYLNLHITTTMKFFKNQILTICPTYFVKPTQFYAHIIDDTYKEKKFFWELDSIPKYKFLKKPPKPFQMVLALNNDRLWYRGLVEVSNSTQNFQIFFIDYGDRCMLPLCNLAQYDESTSLFPGQAHLFCLNFCCAQGLDNKKKDECLQILTDKFVNNEMKVKILKECNGDVFVGFHGVYNRDIKNLIKQGYLEKLKNSSESQSVE